MNAFKAALFSAVFLIPGHVSADSIPPAPPFKIQAQDPGVLLEEGTKKILKAFELFLLTIPQYEAPEVLPNGDIIIRRKQPDGPTLDEEDKKDTKDEPDETRT